MTMAALEASPFSNFSTSALEAFSKRKNGIKTRMVAHERITHVKQLDKDTKISFIV